MSEIVLIPRLNRNCKFIQLQEEEWLTPLNEEGMIEYCKIPDGTLVHGNRVRMDEKQARKMKRNFSAVRYVQNSLIAKEHLVRYLKTCSPGPDCDSARIPEAREVFFRVLEAEQEEEKQERLLDFAARGNFLGHLSYVKDLSSIDTVQKLAEAFLAIEEELSVLICKTTVRKEYGFSERQIEKLLPKPVERPNSYYHSAPSVKLYRKFDVERIYRSDEFREERIRIEKNREKRRIRQERKEKELEERRLREAAETKLRVEKMKTEFPDVHPAALYPEARKMNRRFILYLGPTNSGKTHDALERFMQAETGLYLCPLRLLASEVYDLARSKGIPCSMRTGQEQFEDPEAKHAAATAELADFSRHYEVAVIDECQFLADRQRGGAWTSAILGLQAEEIHLCAAPQAEEAIRSLVSLCQDSLEIVHHQRFTPLVPVKALKSFKKVKAGDCLVTFSRKGVLKTAAELEERKFKVSKLYGALPYSVKRAQAERFAQGESEVLVATDCIGLGMYLPIRRIVFLETKKYDGHELRDLTGEEIRQIAGRAGRYGLQEEGKFAVFQGNVSLLDQLRNQKEPPILQVRMNVPPLIHKIPGKFSEKLVYWQDEYEPDGFLKQDVSERLQKALFLEELTEDYDQVVSLSSIIFNMDHDIQKSFYERSVREIINEGRYRHFSFSKDSWVPNEAELEKTYALLEIQYQFESRLGLKKEMEQTMEDRKNAAEALNAMLINRRRKTYWSSDMECADGYEQLSDQPA